MQLAGEGLHERTSGEGAGDHAEFQRADQEPGRAPGAGGAVGQPVHPAEDQRDLQRQPHHVEALQGPGRQEGPEVRGERHTPGRRGRQHGGDEQDFPVPVQVTKFGQHRDRQRADDQLRGLEPVDVSVVDVQVPGDVGEDGGVVALQDSAGELHQAQKRDDAAHG